MVLLGEEKAVSLQADYYQDRDNRLNYSALNIFGRGELACVFEQKVF